MERLLTKRNLGQFAVVLSAIVVCGCRGQSTAMSNPFLAPDRVPPPATRAIAPGTAQPYYPGDPLPAAQAAPVAAPVAKTQAEAPGVSTAATPPAVAAVAPPAPSVAFSNERSVSIPTDDQNLRFALPQAEPAPMPQMAATPTPVLAATQPAPTPTLAVSTPTPSPAPTPVNPITPAAFNTQVAEPITPIGDEEPAESGWRTPQIRQDGVATQAIHNVPAPAPGLQSVAQPMTPQPVAPENPIPVQLRAVTPPPVQQVMQPIYNPPPRIRFPNFFGTPQPQPVMVSAPVPQPTPAPTQAAAPSSSDGFRPRGSVR